MSKKINGYAKWILVALAFLGIIWNAFTLHYGVKENNAVLQNDVIHLTKDVGELKQDFKSFRAEINAYLLERSNQ